MRESWLWGLIVVGAILSGPSVAWPEQNPIPPDECQFNPNSWSCLEQVKRIGPAPFLAEGYVPQGVASSCEAEQGGRYCIYLERVFVSAYHDPPRPPTGTPPAARPSIIAEVLPYTGMSRCFLLNGDFETSHAGGLAYWRNPADPSEEYLFVSSNGKVGRYRIPEEGTPGGKPRPETSFDCLDLGPPETIDTAASSFVSTMQNASG